MNPMLEDKIGSNMGRGSVKRKNTGLSRNKGFREKIKVLGFLTSLIKIIQESRTQNIESYLEKLWIQGNPEKMC
jgi:hypothetical protein